MTIAIKTRKAKTAKIVSVINRYEFKADPRKVVYQVRSSDGKATYCTYFFCGKATSCECSSRKPCYHMEQLEAYEIKRTAFLAASAAIKAEDARIEALSGTLQGLDQLRREAQACEQEVEESHQIEVDEAEEEQKLIEQAEAEEARRARVGKHGVEAVIEAAELALSLPVSGSCGCCGRTVPAEDDGYLCGPCLK